MGWAWQCKRLSQAWLLLIAVGHSAHAATPCAQGLVVQPDGPAGTILLCSEVEKQLPQLRQLLESVAQGQAKTAERQRDVERLLKQVNVVANRVETRQIELAATLERRLAQIMALPEAGAGRQLRRMADDLEEVNEKADLVARQPDVAEAAAALRPAIVNALVGLDLTKAQRLLNGIEGLQHQLAGVEKKIDQVAESTDENRNATIFVEAVRQKAQGDLGQVRALSAMVKLGRTFDKQDFSGVGFPSVEAAGMQAPGADMSMSALPGATLSGADFSGARWIATNLKGATLAKARLTSIRGAFVNLQQASLQGADLSMTALIASDLQGADLRQASLRGANLAHAVLKDADLRNADLTGAYLGNADLRGAKLDGAVFSNTDVAYAVLSTQQLSDRQIQGLCATPLGTRAERWAFTEVIPSHRTSVGREFERLFEDHLYLGTIGHRPYARCALREEGSIAEWNAPIYRHSPSQEVPSDDFGFHVEHALMEAIGRRAELNATVRQAFKRAKEQPRHVMALPQFAAMHARMLADLSKRQAQLTAQPMPNGPLNFDQDTATLFALKLSPSVASDLQLQWDAWSPYGFSQDLGRVRERPQPWPRLFPQDMMTEDLDEVAHEAWRRWCGVRLRSIQRTEAQVVLAPAVHRSTSGWADIVRLHGQPGASAPELAQKLGQPPDRVVAFASARAIMETQRKYSSAFLMVGDVEAVKKAHGRPQDQSSSEVPAQAHFKALRRVALEDGKEWLVWTVEVLPK